MKNGLDYDQGDQRVGKDGLLQDRQVHAFAPWRQTYQLPLGLQTKISSCLHERRARLVAMGYQQVKKRA